MFNKKSLIVLMLIAILAIAFVGWRFETNITHLLNDVILDNKDHFLSCEELPPSSEVTRIVEQHQETIKRIEKVSPGAIYVVIDSHTCPGKADIMFNYNSHRERVAIEAIIDGETFFGVPYRLRNN